MYNPSFTSGPKEKGMPDTTEKQHPESPEDTKEKKKRIIQKIRASLKENSAPNLPELITELYYKQK
jgi:hypothetical protein